MPKLNETQAYHEAESELESQISYQAWMKERELVGVPFNVEQFTWRKREASYNMEGDFMKERDEVVLTIMFTTEEAVLSAPALKSGDAVEAGAFYLVSSGARQVLALFRHIEDDNLPLEEVTFDLDYTRPEYKGYRQIVMRDYDEYLKLTAAREEETKKTKAESSPFDEEKEPRSQIDREFHNRMRPTKPSTPRSPSSKSGSRPPTERPGATSSGARQGGSR